MFSFEPGTDGDVRRLVFILNFTIAASCAGQRHLHTDCKRKFVRANTDPSSLTLPLPPLNHLDRVGEYPFHHRARHRV